MRSGSLRFEVDNKNTIMKGNTMTKTLGWPPTIRRARRLLCGAVLCAALLVVGATLLGIGIMVVGGSAQADGASFKGITSRTVSVYESAQLKLVRHHLYRLEEEGRESGTVRCTVRAIVDITYTNAKVSFTTCSGRNTFHGNGTTSFYVAGAKAYFKGVLTVRGGTGTYTHASGNLQVAGTFERKTYALSFKVTGKLRI